MSKLFTFAALAAAALADTEIVDTCISNPAHLHGMHSEEALPFSDYNYLQNTEEFNTIYRMTRLQMCANADGVLTGLRAHVTRYDADTMVAVSRLSMNIIGTIVGDGISC